MKKLSIIITIMLLTFGAQCQHIKMDANGNYTSVKKQKSEPTNIGKTYTDSKGVVYPIYKGAKGGMFIIRTSAKTNKTYKQYLKD
jgi:hypothetical protein